MSWFLRKKQNIGDNIPREMPDGLFTQCPSCKTVIYKKQFEENLFTCHSCNHHFLTAFRQLPLLVALPESEA
ncbi:MAG TPA: hypothetical protein PLQ21_04820, partial [Candidatus Kapabacteria bacterium]|nr:hypothetical protein [Candidatus Kapabacteria bacterium]